MARIFIGIGNAIGALFGVEPKQEDETLEEKINKALAEEREKIKPSREDMDAFLWATGDNNPIHRLQKRARKMGFENTPLAGAHVAAYGEQFIQRVVQNMHEFWGADIKIVTQKNKFRAPVYPGDKILWQVKGYKEIEKDKELELLVTGTVKERGEVVEIKPRLASVYHQSPSIAGPIYSSTYFLDADHLEEFYNSVGGKNDGQLTNMFSASFGPATLIKFLEDKTQTLEGENDIMNFEFMQGARPGNLQVDVFPDVEHEPRAICKRQQKRDEQGTPILDEKTKQPVMEIVRDAEGKPVIDKYLYFFKVIVSQKTRPIIYGEITSGVPLETARKLNSVLLL